MVRMIGPKVTYNPCNDMAMQMCNNLRNTYACFVTCIGVPVSTSLRSSFSCMFECEMQFCRIKSTIEPMLSFENSANFLKNGKS